MQLILDEVHAMQREWADYEDEDYAAAAIINSSKLLGVVVSRSTCPSWVVLIIGNDERSLASD